MAKKKEKTEVRQFDKITNRKDSPTVVRRRSPTVVRRRSPTQKSKGRDLGVYVNLLTDFGFKRIFGIKEVMLNFLNTILASKIKDKIVDLHYDNTERLGITQSDRKAIYDLICTTEKDERIVVEMQALWHEYFMDRIVSYASRMIQDQNIVGEDWDFKLQPVYLISIVNFPFDKAERFANKHTSFVQLVERDTRQVFYNKLTFVFIELPRFNKELHQLKTFFEKWIYIIRNLHTMKELPDKFRNEVFEKLFEVAKIARMTKEEKDTYNTSLKNLRAMNIARIEINKLKNANALLGKDLASKDKALAIKDQLIAAKEKELAELRRKFGIN